MAFDALTAEEQHIVLRCMKATVAHIEDWEKHSRLGLKPEELNRIISEWPDIEDADENGIGFLAINNCMNEVCHGFRIAEQDWHTRFETPEVRVKEVYLKWLGLRNVPGGIR
jgi:hypothetical protein